ncbi:MAG: hypothetical protein GY754_36535 [bacterium]|nr:hypothetical protein [bacterium]
MKNFFINCGRYTQKTLIFFFLSIVYIIGVGITSALTIFFRGVFKKDYESKGSYWINADEYENKMENYVHQS